MHRRTRRWEAHIWVKETGKLLYLGGFESELDAARAFDCAAVKFKGRGYGGTNFDVERTMREDVKRRIEDMSREEVVRAIRDRTLP